MGIIFFSHESYAGCDSKYSPVFAESVDLKLTPGICPHCEDTLHFVGSFTGDINGKHARSRAQIAVNSQYMADGYVYCVGHHHPGGYYTDVDGLTWEMFVVYASKEYQCHVFRHIYYAFLHYTHSDCVSPKDKDGDGIPDEDDLDFLETADKSLGWGFQSECFRNQRM